MNLLDTDHCIAILRGQLDLREHVSANEELAIIAISVAELTHGAYRSQHSDDNLARLEVLLSALIILPFPETYTNLHTGKLLFGSCFDENCLVTRAYTLFTGVSFRGTPGS